MIMVVTAKEMERMRLSLDDLLCELRLKDISSLSEVDYAILESNGKLSVFPRTAAPLSHVLIVDGVLQKDMLAALEKSEAWLRTLLKKQGISDMREIFLLSVADDNSLTLIWKEDCK